MKELGDEKYGEDSISLSIVLKFTTSQITVYSDLFTCHYQQIL